MGSGDTFNFVAQEIPNSLEFAGTVNQTGAPGRGVPSGGAEGQILTKNSSIDYDAEWSSESSLPPATFNAAGVVKQTVYNVRDYGAVGNGTTDDILALQATVDACNSGGGGIVFFPHGTYLISDTLYFRGVSGVSTFAITFQGAGVNTVTLKLKNGVGGGTGGHQIRAVVAGYYGQFGNPLTPYTSETTNYFNMYDMTLDFNGVNQVVTGNVSYGLLLDNRGQNCTIERCNFTNVYAAGYNPGTYTYGIGINTYDSRHVTVRDCQFTNCDYGTFLTTYAQGDLLDASLYNNRYLNTLYHSIYYESGYSARIIGNRITGSGEAGIYGNVITNTLNTDAVITGNYFNTCVSYGIQMNGNNVAIIGNTILNTGYHGISINGQDNTILGNTLTNVGNKVSGSTFRRGIMIQGNYHSVSNNTIKTVGEHGIELSGANHNTITGNTILDAGQLSNGSYNGINLEGSSTYNIVDSNRINAVASNKIGYGIAEASSSDNNNYIGATNSITNVVTSIANIQGAATIALTTPGEIVVNTNANDRGYTLQGATGSISPTYKIANSSGTVKARIGIAGQAGSLTSGSAAGDLVLRAETQSILLTSNGGSSTAMNITSTTDTLADPFNFILGTATGTKIGTSASQKLGFFNATPVVQQSGNVATALSNLGLVTSPTITATTNANLTGPITSSGNATSIASQTGTGNKFVMDTSPTLATPNIGVATGTSLSLGGNLTLSAAGNKINIATGSNASAGTGTLVGGTATISTTAVTASSLVFITDTASSLTNIGTPSVTAISAGTSFTVTSSNVLDTSTFNWLVIN